MENDEKTAELDQQDTQNQEGNDDTSNEDNQNQDQTKSSTEDKTDWKAEALKYKAILDRNKGKNQPTREPSKKSDKLDYGQKAFLLSSGIKADEFDFVNSELKQFNGELDGLITNPYFKSRLDEHRQEKTTDKATPSGTKRATQSSQDTVEYWIAKGELPDDFELRKKVVRARREKESNPFSKVFNK